MKYMRFQNRRTVSIRIVQAVINDKNMLSSPKTVDQLIDFIMPLLVDDKDTGQEDAYEFQEGQEAVAKLVHLIKARNLDLYYEILMKFKRVFVKGGVKRMKFTCTALIFALFRLSNEVMVRQSDGGYMDHQLHEEVKGDEDEIPLKLAKVDQSKIFKCINEMIGLIKGNYPELSLRLYLQGAEAINRLPNYQDLEELAYDFCSNSLLIYEEEISDSDAKKAAINLIVATTYTLVCFGHDNFDTLMTNSVSYCSKLLKKPS